MAHRPRRTSACVLIAILAALAVPALASPALAGPQVATASALAHLAIQQAELASGDGAAGDWLGWSVAIDGDTAVVGAPMKAVGVRPQQGAAYVFTRSGTTWSQQAQLLAIDGAANDNFGMGGVAVSGDIVVVGAPYRDVGANTNQGAAYVFIRTGTSWSQQAQLTALDGLAGDRFGGSVALSGETAIVGASQKAVTGHGTPGAAYVFSRSGTSWSQQAELTATDGASADGFGVAVSIAGDSALVGASSHAVGANTGQGAAYVFARGGGTYWSQQAELTATDGAAADGFGVAVSIAGDSALVGASSHAVGANTGQGAAYVFARGGTSWSQLEQLTAADGAAGDRFGTSVALSGVDALVGAFYKTIGLQTMRGVAYVFGLPSTITPSVIGGHGTISPATPQAFDWGATPTFAFAPDAGYAVKEIKVDGSAVAMTAANAYTFPALTADHAISVEFAAGSPTPTPTPTPTLAPTIGKLAPKSGRRGATVTITGAGFGATRGSSVVKFGKATVKKYVLWSATKIKVKVPKKAKLGKNKVTVKTAGGRSAARDFRVRR
jgi:hypothetical protein